ncbi:MAG: biotin--[acetyl-CoA-carboxylase] ligase [Bacteroidales bacterium]|jgi:BirA family biotin operon repressor/biotin-[acetyl-CoA-carboxylase] ligase|nr:biotin--[acetyl-CoA-carboxylase] ligase [Bacteroidales bacterium]MCI2121892.1 biotin--[acetyl-CoA-carboxylase] ligase [Bacteroidales bacterium]MCI2145664.1 biotin--[acetyl-CoA-carboxylase] ligase [Bacteroidales bacterium]
MKKSFTVKWFDTLDSTNSYAEREIKSLRDKDVIAAQFQTAGRGQMGNKWSSDKDANAMFSIIFKPRNFQAIKQFSYLEVCSLGMCDYLSCKGIASKIKWPNDIYVGDYKISGTLISTFIDNDKVAGIIVGTGLNLNQRHFSPELPNPISLSLLTGKTYDIAEELNRILKSIGKYCDILSGEDATPEASSASREEKIKWEYIGRLYRLGEVRSYTETSTGNTVQGNILGVNTPGQLVIRLTDGSLRSYSFKEIKYLL